MLEVIAAFGDNEWCTFYFLKYFSVFLMFSNIKNNGICYTEEGTVYVTIPRILMGIQE